MERRTDHEQVIVRPLAKPIVVLLLAFLGTSVIWLVGFLYSWILAEFGCQSTPAKISVAGIGLVAWMQFIGRGILIMLVMALLFYARWVKSQFARGSGETGAMNRFLAQSGWIASIILLAVMLVETVPVFYYLRSCW